MKLTVAKRRLLLQLWKTDNGTQEDRDRASFRADPNGTCYASLQNHGMVAAPGQLTDAGRAMAAELAALEIQPR